MKKQSWSLCNCVLAAVAFWLPLGATGQSLWTSGTSRSMVSDRRAAAVGDILSIIVQENNSTAKDRNTQTSKESAVDASISTFFYSPAASGLLTKGGQLPALKYSSSQDFNGGGSIKNSEQIAARMAVRVIDVLPNQNLVIEGRRKTAFGGEMQEIVLRGVVRQEDVSPNNTVFSYNISDASLQFISKGTLSDAQRKGWFSRIWEKVTPF